jgi:hypothetical protein
MAACIQAIEDHPTSQAPDFRSPTRAEAYNPAITKIPVPFFCPPNENLRYATAAQKAEEARRQKKWYQINADEPLIAERGLNFNVYDDSISTLIYLGNATLHQ